MGSMSAATTVDVADDVLLARAYLSRVAEPAHVAVWAFVRSVGPTEAAAAVRAGRAPESVRRATEARRDACDPGADLEAAAHHGIRIVVPESARWPHFAFGALERAGARRADEIARGARPSESGEPVPPLALWVQGGGASAADDVTCDLAALGTRSLGVVGARACTSYGEHVAAEIAFGVAQHDVVVVSGGAYGIDAAAHRAALAAGAATVIVSAGGLDRPYPAGNHALFARAAQSGLVVSESPPGAAPQRQRFLTRNRLIAALSTGTVVVEAGKRSGAANTAAHCTALGRALMAVPGPVTSVMSVGCHALLRREPDPALLVTDARDVLESLGFLGSAAEIADTTPGASTGARQAVLDGLDPVARRVFEALTPRAYAAPESVSVRAGVPVRDVLRAMPLLEVAGLVDGVDGAYRVRRADQP